MGGRYSRNFLFIVFCNSNIVPYEEQLDENIINLAISAIMTCDTLIIVGTSLTVYPAAGFVRYFRGRNLVVINKEQTNVNNN